MEYYSNIIDQCAGDSCKLFRVVNSLSKEPLEMALPEHDDPTKLANEYGTFFLKKIVIIKENLDKFQVQEPRLAPVTPKENLENFSSLSIGEVCKIVRESSNASCRLDPVPTWLVKSCLNVLAPSITEMVDLSLLSGCVPENWKTTVVIPLLKKPGLDLVYKNFRPVSNLPFVFKVVEKAALQQLLVHCEKNAPLPKFQSGFRKYYLTETALLKVQNDILMSMDNKEVTLLILLDLSAAFDTIEHSILLNILQQDFRVVGTALNWFHSSLSGRKQHILVADKTSDDFNLTCGVPQGSCIGPILFTLYVSCLFNITSQHLPSVHGYAYDTQIYLSFRPCSIHSEINAVSVIEKCIADVRSWFIGNRLMINDGKTDFLIIGTCQQLEKTSIESIIIGDTVIKPLESVRNLGSWFDAHMRMNVHIGKICSKAFRGLYNIRQIRKFLTVQSTKTLIHAFVSLHLHYCNAYLFGLPKYHLDCLQKVQNATDRVIFQIVKFDHITPTLINLHWLPATFRVQFKLLLFVYKSLHNQSPSYIKDLLSLKPAPYYALRSSAQSLLFIPKVNCSTLGDRAFAHAAPVLWNSLPLTIRTSSSLAIFKKAT